MRTYRWLFSVWFCAALLGAIVGNAIPSRAQEKPVRETRQWHVAMLPFAGTGAGAGYTAVRVDVIDTEGVCLYVGRTYAATKAPTITAVPKTQLPKGAGCQ